MLRRSVLMTLLLAAAAAAHAQTPPAPPPPRVTFDTTMGRVVIEMDPVGAPKTTAHMLRLFRSRHYVGASLFRVEPGFLIQTGDLDANLVYRAPPRGTGTVQLETATNRHKRGGVALAHGDDPNSGSTSFYFELADNAHLNADPAAPPNTTGYAVFGQVVEGMDVLDRIAAVERHPSNGPFPGKLPLTPIVITAVRVE
jgi:cyclophilin family peptidyl-prolyl cis-trans isomerase